MRIKLKRSNEPRCDQYSQIRRKHIICITSHLKFEVFVLTFSPRYLQCSEDKCNAFPQSSVTSREHFQCQLTFDLASLEFPILLSKYPSQSSYQQALQIPAVPSLMKIQQPIPKYANRNRPVLFSPFHLAILENHHQRQTQPIYNRGPFSLPRSSSLSICSLQPGFNFNGPGAWHSAMHVTGHPPPSIN